ncbi:hypothetical protein GCM10010420_55540 [Streptomyces glaucosporus]|uniref:Uncharacterized protein n=1 Tax=Streptomyces glaucosporus TaxID=284044 RepID=A0ABP5W4G9_9ACTN
MIRPAAARLKSLPAPHRPPAADPPAPGTADGASKDVGRRPSTSRSGPRLGDGRYPIAWLHLAAPGRGAVPTAQSWCACGHDRSAIGHHRVLTLIDAHAAHRENCPLRHRTESRHAA